MGYFRLRKFDSKKILFEKVRADGYLGSFCFIFVEISTCTCLMTRRNIPSDEYGDVFLWDRVHKKYRASLTRHYNFLNFDITIIFVKIL